MNRTERNTLVVENLPLVGYLVSDLCARATHLSRDDLASAGAVALVTAADAYDPTLGIPFGAYARTRILGAFADDMRAERLGDPVGAQADQGDPGGAGDA